MDESNVYTDALLKRYDWKPVVARVRRWLEARGCGCVELLVEAVDAEFGTNHLALRCNTLVVNASYPEGKKFFLLLKPATARADMRSVSRAIGADKARLASIAEVHVTTRCRPGCVPPIASLFQIPLLIDSRLAETSEVFAPSGQPGFATLIRTRDLLWAEAARIVGG
ncbi:MAG: YbaK/EbsC family protein [Gemmatimonadaceae bacterium]